MSPDEKEAFASQIREELGAKLDTVHKQIDEQFDKLFAILHGDRITGNLGLSQKVNIMWNWHTPVVAVVSAMAGTIFGAICLALAERWMGK